MKKRLLSTILALAMVLSMCGIYTSAVDYSNVINNIDWGVQVVDDCTTTDYFKSAKAGCPLTVNTQYGFVSTQCNATSSDHYFSMKNRAYSGSWAASFDMFINDVDFSEYKEASTIRVGVNHDENGVAVGDKYFALCLWNTLVNGTALNESRASKKYVNEVHTDTDYMNMLFVFTETKLYVYGKWNGDTAYTSLTTQTLSAEVADRYFYIALGNKYIGFDNFTVYRPKANIVTIPQSYSYEKLVDDDEDNMLVTPHFGTPTFTEPQGSFTAEIASETDLSTGVVDAYLENEYKSWYAGSCTAQSSPIYLGTKNGYTVNISVPADISPELMNLYLVHKNTLGVTDAEFYAPKSVQVTESLNQNFYSVAISDTHINRWGGPEYPAKNARVLKFMNDALSIGGVRYLSHTGDINDNATLDRAQSMKDTFVKAFENSTVPLIVAAGNHEYDTYTYPTVSETVDTTKTQLTYEQYIDGGYTESDEVQLFSTFNDKTFDRFFGAKTAAITMGSNMLIAKNDFGAWMWNTEANPIFLTLRNALAEKWDASEASYRIVYQHSDDTGKQNDAREVYGTAAFMSPSYHSDYLATNPVPYDIQYTGHYHETYVSGDRVLTLGGSGTDTANWDAHGVISDFTYDENSAKKWQNSAESFFANYSHLDENGNGVRVDSEIPEMQDSFIDDFVLMVNSLEEEFFNANDASAEYNISTITNKIDFNFYDGRTVFIMAPGTYTVSGGEILSQYNSYDNRKTIVVVKVDIPAGSKVEPSRVNVVCAKEDVLTAPVTFTLKGGETGYVSQNTEYLDIVSSANLVKSSFTTENISLTQNNEAVAFGISFPDVKTARISFTNPLSENTLYTLTLSDNIQVGGNITSTNKSFEFTTLPQNGIEFIKNTTVAKAASGYSPATKLTAMVDGVSKKPSECMYEDYVIDYTLSLAAYANTDTATEKQLRLDWIINSEDENAELKTIRPYACYITLDGKRPTYIATTVSGLNIPFSESLLNNSFYVNSENAYDFRIIKKDDTWTLYAKRVQSERYDILFTMSGAAQRIYSGKGYTDLYTSLAGSQSYWTNYIVYPIIEKQPEPIGILGDVSGNGEISTYDASLILQHLVKSITLDENALLRSDVDKSAVIVEGVLQNGISTFDASLILQHIVGIEIPAPIGETVTK